MSIIANRKYCGCPRNTHCLHGGPSTDEPALKPIAPHLATHLQVTYNPADANPCRVDVIAAGDVVETRQHQLPESASVVVVDWLKARQKEAEKHSLKNMTAEQLIDQIAERCQGYGEGVDTDVSAMIEEWKRVRQKRWCIAYQHVKRGEDTLERIEVTAPDRVSAVVELEHVLAKAGLGLKAGDEITLTGMYNFKPFTPEEFDALKAAGVGNSKHPTFILSELSEV